MSNLVKAVFTIDGANPVVGLHDPSIRWNGWACPYFTKENAQRIIDNLPSDQYTCSYDETGDTFRVKFNESEEVADEYSGIDCDGVIMYPVGSFGWVWEAMREKRFLDRDLSGRGGSGEITLIDICEDDEAMDEYYSADEDDREDTLVGWALDAGREDEYNEDSAHQYIML